jgi:hypothetical protein
LKEYGAMMERHMRCTVLDRFPQDVWKKLDEPEMIDQPDLDTYVFIKCISDVVIPAEEHRSVAGTFLIVRYSRVRDFILEGKVELLP